MLAGLRLHRQQTLETEHHVAVAEFLAQISVLYMRGAGALVNILGNKVVVQGAPGTALTAIAAQTGEQRRFGLIQRGDQLAICQRQIVQGRLAVLFDIRIKQPGFQLQIVGQLFVTAGNVVL